VNRFLAVCLVALLPIAARAGGNPDVRIYVSFDPSGAYVHHLEEPTPYTTISAYICLDMIEDGVTSLAFRMENPTHACPGVLATAGYVPLVPT
jgi:hypothetical protein